MTTDIPHIARLERIVRERKLEGKRGQMGLAEASGADKSVVNQWLDNKIKSIHPRFALKLEKNLGYRSNWITTGEEPVYIDGSDAATPPARPADEVLMDQIVELLSLFREADQLGRDTILIAARNARKHTDGSGHEI
jgi:hypothetical protein